MHSKITNTTKLLAVGALCLGAVAMPPSGVEIPARILFFIFLFFFLGSLVIRRHGLLYMAQLKRLSDAVVRHTTPN